MNVLAKLLISQEDKFLFISRQANHMSDADVEYMIDLPTALVAGDSINIVGRSLSEALNQSKHLFRVKERLFWWQYRAQESGYYFGPHNAEIWIYRGELMVRDVSSLTLKETEQQYIWLSLLEAEEGGFDINLSGLISHSISSE